MKTKFNSNLLKATLLSTTLLLSAQSYGETFTTEDGLSKLNENSKNAKLNQKEYEKNLGTVSTNLVEINKAKTTVQQAKDKVTTEILSNNESLKKVLIQEREIQALVTAEQQKIDAEKKQLEQLEMLTKQIQGNIEKREQNIADYNSQLLINQGEKKAWKDREGELRGQEGQVIENLRTIASEERTWGNKKKGYELEVKRWSAESERQQKVYETYKGLKGSN